jgi:hypothetical protein
MLHRAFTRPAAAAAAAALAPAAPQQVRRDHDRWYGHALELDIGNYKYTGEKPAWARREPRSDDEAKTAAAALPHMDFAGTYELLLWDADRLNPHLNRKEFGNEIKFRLEKQANTVARAQALIKQGTHAHEPKTEDSMIARIADEEHVQAEMKYVKCIRANELAEDNRLDILPGGSPTSLREKTRWNAQMELHPVDRQEIMARLTAWLPEKYHIVYYDDAQTVAANDAASRQELKQIIKGVASEHAAEAKAAGYEADLKEVIAELEQDVDPTAHVTVDAINKSTSLDELEEWSRLVHEYNGDNRIFAIYERAATLQKNDEHVALVRQLKAWTAGIKTFAN